MRPASLTINEIYPSVQGESTFAGLPCTFVRLTACDLRCRWCDSPFSFTEGRKWSLDEIADEVRALGLPLVEVTGGEPLLQAPVIPLMARFLDEGYTVLLETGGHRPIDEVPAGVHRIVDVKCPDSGEAGRMHWPNLEIVGPQDEVKFVIASAGDYAYAKDVVDRFDLVDRVHAVHFSPAFGLLEPAQLAEWLMADRLPVRLQLQQHKYIWDPMARRV